jgi:hypothetical protein
LEISAMGAYIDKKVDNFNRTESESYLQSIIDEEGIYLVHFRSNSYHSFKEEQNSSAIILDPLL